MRETRTPSPLAQERTPPHPPGLLDTFTHEVWLVPGLRGRGRRERKEGGERGGGGKKEGGEKGREREEREKG